MQFPFNKAGLLWTAVAAYTLCAQSPARPEFEIASIKLNTTGDRFVRMRPPAGGSFTATNVTLKTLIAVAYNVKAFAISGGPAWIDTAKYDVAAKSPEDQMGDTAFRQRMQTLLVDRFHLSAHQETRIAPVYALVPAKGGLHLPNAKAGSCSIIGQGKPGVSAQPACPPFSMDVGKTARLEGLQTSMPSLVSGLASLLSRPVVDDSGFTGVFDVNIEFAPPDLESSDSAAPSIFTALEEQLGLRLEARKGPADFLIIDHVEKPDEN